MMISKRCGKNGKAALNLKGRPAGWLSLLVFSVVLLAGCQEFGTPHQDPTPTGPTEYSTSPPPTGTHISINLATHTPTSIPQHTPTPTTKPATPEFSLTQDPVDSFDPWRPPVYPVPWIPSPYDHFYFQNPIAADDIDTAFTTYGYGGVFFKDVTHTGIDIPGDIGTPILAAGSGTVVYAGQGIYRGGNYIYDDPYGKAVVIEHDFNYQGEPLFTLYAHLDEILVEKDQFLNAGDQVGLLGNTGKTTGPHLHFEVRLGENDYFSTRNPDLWLSPPQGWGVLVGQVNTYAGRSIEKQTVYLYPAEDNPVVGPVKDVGWIGTSYQNDAINSDPYYHENFTLANLPAGNYYVYIPVTDIGLSYSKLVEIKPGQVTYFRFNLWKGFTDQLPPTPEYLFSPSP